MSLIEPSWPAKIIGAIKEHWILSLIAFGVLIILLIWLLGSGGSDKKIDQDVSNISEHKGEANVIGNLITNQQTEVNNAANKTNKAVNELGDSVNRPSNSFNGNGANDRFCRDFPGDPSCGH